MARRKTVYMPLSELVSAPVNPKDHATALIAKSIDRFGLVEIPTLDERTGCIISGHGRRDDLLARKANGDPPPDDVQVKDGEWLIPVSRGWASADDDEALAAGIALNQVGPVGGWKLDELAPALQHLQDLDLGLDAIGFEPSNIDDILATLAADAVKDRPRASDEVPDPPKVPITKPGDLWVLGDHRLLCGDSFRDEDVDRLLDGFAPAMILMDPPFAIYGSSSGISASVADDKMVRPFFEQLGRMSARILPDFAQIYVCCDWRSYATMWEAFKRSALVPKNCLVWDKGGSGLGNNWSNAHEFVAYFAKLPPQQTMTSGAKAGQRAVLRSNILRYARATGDDRQHNAAKPVAMLTEIIEAGADEGGGVVDLFGGSGSTLMAAEQSGRRCAMMEMEPSWCDVIVARWEALTGQKATREPA